MEETRRDGPGAEELGEHSGVEGRPLYSLRFTLSLHLKAGSGHHHRQVQLSQGVPNLNNPRVHKPTPALVSLRHRKNARVYKSQRTVGLLSPPPS